jgi:hypothetical protein
MAKEIARVLKTDMLADIEMPALAQLLQKMGRKGDKILAHITPKEAKKLKKEGGAGTINPATGLPEFYDGEDNLGQVDASQFPELYQGGELPQADQETWYNPPYLAVGSGQEYPSINIEEPAKIPTVYAEGYSAPAQEAAGLPAMTGVPARMTPGVPDMEALRQPDTLGGMTPQTPEEKSFLDKLTPQQKLQLGLGIGSSLAAGLIGQRGAKQAQQAKREISDIGAPYRQTGQQMIGAAQRGELTPVGQQTLQAARARLSQDVQSRGGVGAQQMETQLANLRNNLLEQQYNYGLKVASIGDQYAARAVSAGLTQDQEMAKLMQNMAASISGMFGAQPGK